MWKNFTRMVVKYFEGKGLSLHCTMKLINLYSLDVSIGGPTFTFFFKYNTGLSLI